MLTKPDSCQGCPLFDLGEGFMASQLPDDNYGVLLVGEALGREEVETGKPFTGASGFKLTRLIEWAGLDRSKFMITNTVHCRPPYNKLEGESYGAAATSHCRDKHWGGLVSRARVLVPMGNVAFGVLSGGKKQILKNRGYVVPGPDGTHLVPTVHPSFIQRGQSKYSAAFIHDIQKAVGLAETGLPPHFVDYLIDPSPRRAYEWAKQYRAELLANPEIRLAYDIETPGKGEDEGATEDDSDRTYHIWRIGFSYRPYEALTVPWTPEYIPAIRLLMESEGEKAVWNAGFDNPRIRHNGVGINGLVHDGMVAWHILHSDLPKGLGFVATFTCPYQPPWKHLSGSSPGFYNCTDADVELRSMIAIEEELRKTGLWDVYQRDVLDLEPILVHMTSSGMPIDQEVRLDRALQLAERQTETLAKIESLVPIAARRYGPKEGFKKEPEDTTDLIVINVEAEVKRCSKCRIVNPTKPHFTKKTIAYPGTAGRKKGERVNNPCFGGEVVTTTETVSRYARLEPFKPSREQLIRYQQVTNRTIPTKYDKKQGKSKQTMDEKAIKKLIGKYPLDPLYPLVLEYRELDKIAGTYIGRPAEGV